MLVSLAFRARHLFVRMKCSFIKTGNSEPSQVIPLNSYYVRIQLEPTSPLWIRIGIASISIPRSAAAAEGRRPRSTAAEGRDRPKAAIEGGRRPASGRVEPAEHEPVQRRQFR